jgi:sugar phosphate isomerase/epimerase
MLSISTSWKSDRANTADEIIRPILDLGVRAVELEYRVTEEIFKQMLPGLKRNEPAVSSAHNFFPVPPILRKEEGSGDAFLLSSPEKEERERAVKYTLRTLEFAREAGASAVVLHLGFTEMDDKYEFLKEKHEKGAPVEDIADTQKLITERRSLSRKYLDAALFSLDKLWRPAERLSLKLGIENRNTLREVPNADEMGVIFDRFEGSPIGYWHDTGHGFVQELFYGINHEEQLSKFSNRLIGVHLHDAIGGSDHKAPGKGNIDFEMVKKYLAPSTLRVVEVHCGVSAQELREGLEFLRDRGLISAGELL